jgi:hypothetical protein
MVTDNDYGDTLQTVILSIGRFETYATVDPFMPAHKEKTEQFNPACSNYERSSMTYF